MIRLLNYLRDKEQELIEIFEQEKNREYFKSEHLRYSIYSYIKRPAKRLRPGVLLLSSGCLGGPESEKNAIFAAAGIELFHTCSLVHDDIIDNESLRRGGPTVHKYIQDASRKEFGISIELSKEYGRNIAILTGDIQLAWSVKLFMDTTFKRNIDPYITLECVRHLETYVIGNLSYGQTLDIQFGFSTNDAIEKLEISEDKILDMLWLKTGVLYEFAGMAGSMIGKNTSNPEDTQVCAIKNFTSNCGVAFQLQDDILGIIGDEKTLGKTIGSDIREGKKTTIVLEALKNSNENQKNFILSTLGNKTATNEDVEKFKRLLVDLNGIEHTKNLAKSYIDKAINHLKIIDNSYYKELLLEWADYMINREF